MDFGVHPSIGELTDRNRLKTLLGELENYGYSGVYLADSLSEEADPLTVLAAASTIESSLLLGTCVYILPMRNPLLVAKQTSTIQRLSHGRLVFGVGVGWRDFEFEALQAPFAERGQVMDESIEIMLKAWREEAVSYQGKHFRLEGVDVGALCSPERPRLWVGGNSVASMKRAWKYANAWIPTDFSPEDYAKASLKRSELGLDSEKTDLAAHLALLVSRDRAAARNTAASVAQLFGETAEEFSSGSLVGSPEDVARRLEDYVGQGVRHVVVSTHLLGSPDKEMEAVRLFAQEVMPSFKK